MTIQRRSALGGPDGPHPLGPPPPPAGGGARFIAGHGHLSPPVGGGGGRARPDRKALDWQKLLIEHGYVARTIPAATAATAPSPTCWRRRSSPRSSPRPASARHPGPGHQHAGADAARGRHRGAEAAAGSARPSAARSSGARATRSRAPGSDLASLQTRGVLRGRALRHQRPEDLDQLGALRRHDVPAAAAPSPTSPSTRASPTCCCR